MNRPLAKERYQLANRIAINEGLVGEAFFDRMLRLLEDWEEYEECAELINLREMMRDDNKAAYRR